MAPERASRFRSFAATRLGRAFLVGLAVALVTLTFASPQAGPFIAIPIFLLVGLAVPIYSGVKRPRFLALLGLVVILVVAPVSTASFTQSVMTPIDPAYSYSTPGVGAVLSNAVETPFVGAPGTNFSWSVTVVPAHLPSDFAGSNWSNASLSLFISTCPGATIPNETYCNAGYPFTKLVDSFPSGYTGSANETLSFHYVVSDRGLWNWQMTLLVYNRTNVATSIPLNGSQYFGELQGPVVGDYATVYGYLIFDIFFTALLYLGLPFYVLLMFYMLLKNRERRRLAWAEAAKIPPESGSGSAAPGPTDGPSSAPLPGGSGPPHATPGESTCPNCQAVVYPSESKCWKCGAMLAQGGAGDPPH